MLVAIIGSLLILCAVSVYCWARLPNRRSTDRMRQQALARYRTDIDADQPD